jgi:hypothetical protein
MVCGAPTCPACSVAGLCKADLDKLGGADADRLEAIQRELKKANRVAMATFCATLLSILGTLGFIMINFQSHLGLISSDSIFWLLALAFGPMFVMMPFMIRFKDQAMALIRERDAIIRERHIKLAHVPRDGYYSKYGYHTFTCSSCQGPAHVERAICKVCYKPICPNCDEGGFCPAHSAGLTNEDKELLLKSGDFMSKLALNVLPIGLAELVLVAVIYGFGLPWPFFLIPLALAILAVFRFLSIMNAQKRLKAKTGLSGRQGMERPF